jgi:phosphatidate cytidylyltransferase
MAAPDPAGAAGAQAGASGNRNLLLRVASALILAPLAIGVTYWGGWPFIVFWTIAALAVWWEWVRLIDPEGSQGALALGGCALVLEALLAGTGRMDKALLIVGLALLGVAVTAARETRWVAGGIVYASALLIASVAVRADAQHGFWAVLLLFGVVWSADIGGYFGGRAFGGPKLAPSVSPKKTWSGAIVGTLLAVVAAIAIVHWPQGSLPLRSLLPVACLALLLAAVSQAGDLFESALKRRFGAKDASGLIPGHGGVMDRLDGFIFAVLAAALIGTAREGLSGTARGLLVW